MSNQLDHSLPIKSRDKVVQGTAEWIEQQVEYADLQLSKTESVEVCLVASLAGRRQVVAVFSCGEGPACFHAHLEFGNGTIYSRSNSSECTDAGESLFGVALTEKGFTAAEAWIDRVARSLRCFINH